MRILIALCFTFSAVCSQGQTTETYFDDNEPKESGTIHKGTIHSHLVFENSIIMGGQSFEKFKYQPVIMRIDTLGNVLWNTGLTDTFPYVGPGPLSASSLRISNLILGKDNYIYAACFDSPNSDRQIWKVDPTNGAIIWRQSFNASYGLLPWLRSMIDYDSSKFMVIYTAAPNDVRFAFIEKLTGNITSSYKIGDIAIDRGYALTIDNQGDIYFSSHADSIYKVSGSNPSNIIWRKRHTSPIEEFHKAYFDSITNCIYFIGTTGGNLGGVIAKVHSASGTIASSTYVHELSSGVKCQDFKAVDSSLYIAWTHISYGSLPYRFRTTKYDMLTGTSVWNNAHIYTGSQLSTAVAAQSVISLDIDDSLNVYACGYYSILTKGGHWGILKINGISGNVIYEKTISNDTLAIDVLSSGKVSCIIGNRPYFLGELETAHNPASKRSMLTLVGIDPSTGNLMNKAYMGGSYQFPSKTISIKTYLQTNTLVMKQVGRMVSLEMYNFDKTLKWEKTFTKDYFLIGGDMAIAPNGDIYFSGSLRKDRDSWPFYRHHPDSIYLFKIDSLGNIINKYGFYVSDLSGIVDASTVELHADNEGAFIFYYRDKDLFVRRSYPNYISHQLLVGKYNPIATETKTFIDWDTTKGYLFVYNPPVSGTSIRQLNKKFFGVSNFDYLPSITTNVILPISNDKVLYGGKNYFDQEILGLYDFSIKDTLWGKTLSNVSNSQVLDIVTDSDNKYIYTVSSNSDNIVVRKLSVADGSQQWSYIFNGIGNGIDFPMDIKFDDYHDQIIVTGYETETLNEKRALVLVFDTLGILINSIKNSGDFSGDNVAAISHVLPDGSQWVGGNLNKSPYGLAGFIWEIDTSCVSSGIGVVNASSCEYYLSPINNFKWTKSGTYIDIIPNTGGCDSIIMINLTIHNSDSLTEVVKACKTYTWPVTGTVYTTSGIYSTSFINSKGCDSIRVLDLTISQNSTHTQTLTACKSYTWSATNNSYSSSGIYTTILKGIAGCDSTVTLNLTINNVDTNVAQNQNTLAATPGATYQWIDCSTGSPIPNATGQSFTATANGSYAVIISKMNCVDTSACYAVSNVGLNKNADDTAFSIYPNPTNGKLTIQLENAQDFEIAVTDILGLEVLKKKFSNTDKGEVEMSGAAGIYLITVKMESGETVVRVVKE